jgi:hypothetical protein
MQGRYSRDPEGNAAAPAVSRISSADPAIPRRGHVEPDAGFLPLKKTIGF